MDFKNQRSHELYYLLISWLEFYIMQSCIKPYVIFCKLCNSYFVLDISIYLSLPIILCTHHQHSQFRRVPLQSSTPSQSQLSILVEYGSWHLMEVQSIRIFHFNSFALTDCICGKVLLQALLSQLSLIHHTAGIVNLKEKDAVL